MEFDTFFLIFFIFSIGIYLMMQPKLSDLILGFVLLSNGINLMILFTSGNPDSKMVPIIVGETLEKLVDPLPQALILTAIVIGFGLTAFTIVFGLRLLGYFGTQETQDYLNRENHD